MTPGREARLRAEYGGNLYLFGEDGSPTRVMVEVINELLAALDAEREWAEKLEEWAKDEQKRRQRAEERIQFAVLRETVRRDAEVWSSMQKVRNLDGEIVMSPTLAKARQEACEQALEVSRP